MNRKKKKLKFPYKPIILFVKDKTIFYSTLKSKFIKN